MARESGFAINEFQILPYGSEAKQCCAAPRDQYINSIRGVCRVMFCVRKPAWLAIINCYRRFISLFIAPRTLYKSRPTHYIYQYISCNSQYIYKFISINYRIKILNFWGLHFYLITLYLSLI